jgi:hypothetical protein
MVAKNKTALVLLRQSTVFVQLDICAEFI